MSEVVIDTNVLAVANFRAPQASAGCMRACISALRSAREGQRIVVDDGFRIFREYRRHASLGGEPGAGDAFLLWLWSNQGNLEHCRQVRITPLAEDPEDFEELPRDPALAGFDRADRKFVAVALACDPSPPILNAVDTDWWDHREALEMHGVEVTFLCPEQMMG